MKRDQFERVVNEAIAELPEEFRRKLENVIVIVDDCPSDELLHKMEVPIGDTLFGLYEGTPLTDRGFIAPLYPDRISIFQKPLEEEYERENEMKEEMKTTNVRDVVQCMGLSAEYMHNSGYL